MKLRKPSDPTYDETKAVLEERYLTHCANIALIISGSSDSEEFEGKIKTYFETTDANWTR